MDKKHLRRVAILAGERPYEIKQFITHYINRYHQQPSYEEIADYLCVAIGTVEDDIKKMRKNGFVFNGRMYKTIGIPAA